MPRSKEVGGVRRLRSKWQIRWTDFDGKRRSEVYGSEEDATFALQRHLTRVEELRRGVRQLAPVRRPFDELCKEWLETRAAGKRSKKKDEQFIRTDLLPAFGGKALTEIGTRDVERFKAERLERLSKKSINLMVGLLRSMLNLAVEIGWLEKRPTLRLYRIPLFGADYRYLRTDEEVQRFLRAAREEGADVFALYATAVLTGLRAGELAGLRWEDVDLDRRLITVQRSFGGPTKAGDLRHVPILDALLPVLREWRLATPGPITFPSQAGSMLEPCSRVFQETLRRVLAAAGFPKGYLTFHSLRHSFASHWMMKGGDLYRLQKVLGHKSAQMTLRYSHLSPSAFAADHARLQALVPAAQSGADVIPLPSKT